MKKWEAVALQEFSQWFIMDVDDDREWIFIGMKLGNATIKGYKRILDIFCRNDLQTL